MTGGSGGGVQLNPTIVTECFSTMVMVCHVAVSQNKYGFRQSSSLFHDLDLVAGKHFIFACVSWWFVSFYTTMSIHEAHL
jgi:hypothetical protein